MVSAEATHYRYKSCRTIYPLALSRRYNNLMLTHVLRCQTTQPMCMLRAVVEVEEAGEAEVRI